jgi:hypothetical protein
MRLFAVLITLVIVAAGCGSDGAATQLHYSNYRYYLEKSTSSEAILAELQNNTSLVQIEVDTNLFGLLYVFADINTLVPAYNQAEFFVAASLFADGSTELELQFTNQYKPQFDRNVAAMEEEFTFNSAEFSDLCDCEITNYRSGDTMEIGHYQVDEMIDGKAITMYGILITQIR